MSEPTAKPRPFHLAGRIFFGLMTLLLLYAVAVQYNDPDPIRWMVIYGVAAVLCGVAASGRRLPRATIIVPAVIAAAWAAWTASVVYGGGPLNQMFPGEPGTGYVIVDTEEGREMGGLIIVTLTLLLLAAFNRTPSRS